MSELNAFLSQRAQGITFPKTGTALQSLEAAKSKINCTAGVVIDDQGSLVSYSFLRKLLPDMKSEQLVGYAPSFGLAQLRQAWKEEIVRKSPSLKGQQFSQPLVTSGITHSLSLAAFLFVDEGTPVLMSDLSWPNYRLIFEKGYAAQVRYYPSFKNERYNFAALAQRLEEGKEERQVILLNFPHNPSGYTPTAQEVSELKTLLYAQAEQGKRLLILCDDAYFGLNHHEEAVKESLFAYLADLHKNIIVVKHDGATKEEFGWGLRLAFISFAGAALQENEFAILEDKASAAIRFSISNASRLSQELMIKMLNTPRQEEKQGYHQLLSDRYATLMEELKAHSQESQHYFQLLPCNSGFFLTIELHKSCAGQIRKTLLKDYNIGVIAIQDKYIRITFASLPQHHTKELVHSLLTVCREVFNYVD